MAGVESTGFVAKTTTEILADIEARQKAAFGASINLGGESVFGQLNATIADSIAEGWEVLSAVYRSLYPDSATGEALDNVAAITGVLREPATRSTMVVTCTGTAGTLLAVGRVVSVTANGNRFVSTAAATIGGGGTVDVDFEAEEIGAVVGAADTLTIETPVAGWTSAANALDAEVGSDLETDAELRLRRQQLLRAQGDATVESILADLLEVTDVNQVFLFSNDSDFTDSRGLPPHSIECIVDGGTDADVAEQIFLSKGAGIATYGEPGQIVTETVTDSQGFDHTINFTRPDPIEIYIDLEVEIVAADYPVDGDDQIKAALVALGDTLVVGEDVISERFQAEVFSVSGVRDLTDWKIDTIAVPVGTGNIAIDFRELATFDTSRVTVSTV